MQGEDSNQDMKVDAGMLPPQAKEFQERRQPPDARKKPRKSFPKSSEGSTNIMILNFKESRTVKQDIYGGFIHPTSQMLSWEMSTEIHSKNRKSEWFHHGPSIYKAGC